MISVCIATYNGSKYIEEQITSILYQLSEEDEIIISDDGSSDDTLQKIRTFNDLRIKIYNGPSISLTKNFENAFFHAKGDYIFTCDQDDVWEPNKVNIMMKYLNKYDLVLSDCSVVDKNLNIINNSYFSILHSGPGFLKNLYKTTYLGCCMAFKAHLLKRTLPFPPNIIMHDIWIAMYADLCGKTIFINDKLIKYRRHGENASTSSSKSYNSILFKIKYRLYLVYHLIIRAAKWKFKC